MRASIACLIRGQHSASPVVMVAGDSGLNLPHLWHGDNTPDLAVRSENAKRARANARSLEGQLLLVIQLHLELRVAFGPAFPGSSPWTTC